MLLQVTSAQDAVSSESLVKRELLRRQAAAQEGHKKLLEGDEFYALGEFKQAASAYVEARKLLPESPATAELRTAADQRYAQATIEYSKELSRKGKTAEGKEALDLVLGNEQIKNYPEANLARNELDDPVRNNPALSGEHVEKIDQVRRSLYMAQGAFDLGKMDQARKHYEETLRIDPYNKAARRGLEKIAGEKSRYYHSSYDQLRAEAFMQVERNWELPLDANSVVPLLPTTEQLGAQTSLIPVSNKLKRIIIPRFTLQEATLMEAVDLLRLRAAENDNLELDPAQKGINITVNLGDTGDAPAKNILEKTFDLNLSNVPVETILKYITDITRTSYRPDDYAVNISRLGTSGDGLVSRTYRVPPDFLSSLSSGATTEAKNDDIFNTTPSSGGLLAKRMSAQEALAIQGISFPDGASAYFNSITSTLRVVNTTSNQDMVEQVIDSITQTEPVIVSVRVTMLKVEKNILEELGFDWMLNDFGFGGGGLNGNNAYGLTGGTVGNGTIIDDFPLVPANPAPLNPITAGNRSGDGALVSNALDELLASGGNRNVQNFSRAPGILGVNGVLDNTTIQTLMRGLDQKKGADVMAKPAVTTRSGQAASVIIIDEFMYPTEYEPPQVPATITGSFTFDLDDLGNIIDLTGNPVASPILPAFPTAFETKDTGIVLEVLPVADANRQYIDITLNPSITAFDGFVNYGTPIFTTAGEFSQVLAENEILMPVFSVKRLNTNLVVVDGSTIVIGGLLKEVVTSVNDKTPILGDIPVVGRLFQSNSRKHTSTAILFLVNVELVDPTGRPYRKR